MPYTLLQANTFAGDLRDALRLLSADNGDGPTGGPPRDLWATIETAEATALRLAPRIATLLGRRVVVTTVDGPRCRVTLAAPTGEVVGPIDGRTGGRVEEFASTFGDSRLPWKRRAVAWPTLLIAALGDQQVPAHTRHATAARVLGLPAPTDSFETSASAPSSVEVALPPPTAVAASDLRRTYLRRRAARRTRTGTGVLAIAAGAVASISWTDRGLGGLAVSGGAMIVLILVWLVLRRALR